MPNLITVKISIEGRRMLRLVAAASGKKQHEVMEHLLRAELKKRGLK